MEYRPEIGKIYDTLFFCTEYFNKQEIKNTVTNCFIDSFFMSECYREVEKSVPSLPPVLKPLFFYRNQIQTVMTSFFTKYIDYQNDTIDSFLEKIIEESDFIYAETLSTLFPDVSDVTKEDSNTIIASEAFINALIESQYPEDFKLRISFFLWNFNYVISVLIRNLLKIYNAVDTLHQRHSAKVTIVCTQICSEHTMQRYKQLLALNGLDCGVIYNYFSVSLLNQYIIKELFLYGAISLLFGFKYEDRIKLQLNEQNIDLRKFLIAVGNNTRLSILHTLTKFNELTATSIAKIIEVPLTTALRHVEILYDSSLIYISRRSGLQIFYRVNGSLLMNTLDILNQKAGDYIDEQTKQVTAEKME